ncbi:unnamed protein product [Cuscuta europaea]|uniref:Uncharacterized protein n=1 Tax=Cuscuta europaea TaxID=41803 RepID=A0A9P1A389_CUSEU|nr:unnamed protein product [Cuscuta europaea]
MTTGNPSEPGSASQATSPLRQQPRAPYIPPNQDMHDALEDAVIHDKWPKKWTEWDDLRCEAESEDMQRNWWLRELLAKCAEDIIRLDEEELKKGEDYKKTPKELESLIRQSAGQMPTTAKPWENLRINAPFQEEIRKGIWRKPDKLKQLNELKIRGLTHLKGKLVGGHLHMLHHRSSGKQRQILEQDMRSSIHPIHASLDIHKEDHHSVPFYSFRVQRTDSSELICQENDFIMMNMDDIYQMFMVCRFLPLNHNKVYREGFEAIKRFMLRQIRFHAAHDLQMALENNVRKANLTRPTLYGEELEEYEPYHIFTDPPSILYLNHQQQKRLMWVEDIHKYCDGTLKVIQQKLLPIKEDIDQRLAEATDEELRECDRVETILKPIIKQLDKRRSLRSYEHALNFRKHYFRAQK